MSLIEVRLRPTGPWRVGHRAGDRERVDVIYHSDALYSAVTHAMRSLGWLEEWLEATARTKSEPAVRFSSLFPFVRKTRLVAPPKSAWPPAGQSKLYLQGAKLVPLEVVKSGLVEESRWSVDGESECLVPVGSGSPFHVSMRSAAAVDRLTGATEPHRIACLEFVPNAGWWGVFSASDEWEPRVKSAFRLLADSGFGGERSRGWGRAADPQFSDATHLFAQTGAPKLYWLLSLFSPHESDVVDWSRSEYTATVRGGWTDSPAGAAEKKHVRMIEEGSVLASDSLLGNAVDVAPDGFAHPVYRSGIALAMPTPSEIVVRAQSEPPKKTEPPTPEPVPAAEEPLPIVEATLATPEEAPATPEEETPAAPEEPLAVTDEPPVAAGEATVAEVEAEPQAPAPPAEIEQAVVKDEAPAEEPVEKPEEAAE